MVIETGQAFQRPGGNLRIKVKTKEACFRLERQEVTILGSKYRFREFDILADRFYIDVSSVDSDVDADLMLKRFFELGAQPIYGTFRDVNLDAVMTTATWRVYLRSNECPPQLFVEGSVCDQLVFAGRIHPVHAKDAPFPAQRMSFGYRSRYALELQDPTTTTAAVANTRTTTQQQTKGDVIATRASTGCHRSTGGIASSTKDEQAPSELSLSTNGSVMLTPPGSPKPTLKQLPPPSSEFTTNAERKGKRTRSATDFANMLMKSRPRPLVGVATSNYFDVLSKVEVDFDCCSATLDEQHGPRFQIVPRKVKAPVKLSESKEASHFLTKHHTSIVKTEKPLPIQEIVAEMESTEETADLQLLPDRLAVADSKVSGSRKVLRNTNNVDTVVYYASCSTPLAFNTVLLQEMNATSSHVSDLAHLHLINRVLSATDPDESTTFAHKWAKHLASADSTKELIRASRALALFELMLMCTAPRIFEKDYWLQHVTGMSIAWIPAHNRRLLHPNLLLALLRSKLGKICFKLWEDVQWQGSLLDDLEALRASDGFYPDDASVLQLQKIDDELTLVAGPLSQSL
ncbi:hypothetical protein Plhal710r2_c076g0179361 [Plasmopara halstedii]